MEKTKRLTKAQLLELDIMEDIQRCKKMYQLKKNGVIYTRLDNVSRSGMSRQISCFVGVDNEIINISWFVAKLTGSTRGKDGGVKIGGCGMDMGFALVYDFNYQFWKRLYPGNLEQDGTYENLNKFVEENKFLQRWL